MPAVTVEANFADWYHMRSTSCSWSAARHTFCTICKTMECWKISIMFQSYNSYYVQPLRSVQTTQSLLSDSYIINLKNMVERMDAISMVSVCNELRQVSDIGTRFIFERSENIGAIAISNGSFTHQEKP